MTDEKRKQLIEQIKNFPERLEDTLREISITQLDTPYGPGKWTIRQVVHHLADSHLQGFARVKWALTENDPQLKIYDQDEWAKLPDSAMPIDSSLAILKGLHQRWAALFESINGDAWKRPVQHPDPDYSNIEEILAAYAAHGEKHLGHISHVLK